MGVTYLVLAPEHTLGIYLSIYLVLAPEHTLSIYLSIYLSIVTSISRPSLRLEVDAYVSKIGIYVSIYLMRNIFI
jgi:hypothetical protein